MKNNKVFHHTVDHSSNLFPIAIRKVLLFALLTISFPLVAYAGCNEDEGTKYYVDSNYQGTSTGSIDSPAKRLVEVAGNGELEFEELMWSNQKFSPCDQILFKRDSVFNERLFLFEVEGDVDKPVTFGAYGEGENPIFDGQNNGQGTALYANSVKYVKFENLVFKNSSGDGMQFWGEHIELENIESHNHGGHGLTFQVFSKLDSKGNALVVSANNISILKSKFHHNDKNGINITNLAYEPDSSGSFPNSLPCRGCTFSNIKLEEVESDNNHCAGARLNTSSWNNGFAYQGWTQSATNQNIWYNTQYQMPENEVLFNGVEGTQKLSLNDLSAPNEWYWEALSQEPGVEHKGRIYVYSEVDPSITAANVSEADSNGIEVVSKFKNIEVLNSQFLNNGLTEVDGELCGTTYPKNENGTSVIKVDGGRGLSIGSSGRSVIDASLASGVVDQYQPTYWSEGLVIDNVTSEDNGGGGIIVAGFKPNQAEGLEAVIKNSTSSRNGVNSQLGGIWTSANQDLVIENNQVHDNKSNWIDGVGIFVDQHDERVIVRYNHISGNQGCYQEPDYYVGMPGRGCSDISDFGGGGIALYNSTDNIIYKNLIENNRTGLWVRHQNTMGNVFYQNMVKNNINDQVYWDSADPQKYPQAPSNGVYMNTNTFSGLQTNAIQTNDGIEPLVVGNCFDGSAADYGLSLGNSNEFNIDVNNTTYGCNTNSYTATTSTSFLENFSAPNDLLVGVWGLGVGANVVSGKLAISSGGYEQAQWPGAFLPDFNYIVGQKLSEEVYISGVSGLNFGSIFAGLGNDQGKYFNVYFNSQNVGIYGEDGNASFGGSLPIVENTTYMIEMELTTNGPSVSVFPQSLGPASGLTYTINSGAWNSYETYMNSYRGPGVTGSTQVSVDNIMIRE